MKGSLVKYNVPYSGVDYVGVVIDYMEGYNLRKTWSEKCQFIEDPLIKIFWFACPNPKPPSATREIGANWNISPQLTFGFAQNMNNYTIDEWGRLLAEPDWYSIVHFSIIKEAE